MCPTSAPGVFRGQIYPQSMSPVGLPVKKNFWSQWVTGFYATYGLSDSSRLYILVWLNILAMGAKVRR